MGRSDFWSKVFNKKTSKSLKTTAKRVKTQLEWAIPGLRVVNAVNTVWKATEVAGNVSSAAQTVNEAIPEVVLAGKSIASSASKAAYAAAFTSVISTVGTFGGLAIAYQGTQALNRIARDLNNISRSTVAHIGLTAPREFAQNVCDFINEKMHMHPDKGRTEHAFFVYHPDTDWTSPFADILWNGGLHDREGRYRGRTSNLDFATIMMLQTLEREEEPGKKLKLHLIIPAYRLLLIEEPIRLPEALGELRIHGKIHDSTEYVWINLPQEQASCLDGVGRLQRETTWLEWVSSWLPGTTHDSDSKRRDLGSPPSDSDDEGYASDRATIGSSDSIGQDDRNRYARNSRGWSHHGHERSHRQNAPGTGHRRREDNRTRSTRSRRDD